MRRRMSAALGAFLAIAALAISAATSRAQEAGTVVDIEDTVEIGRAGTWTPATINSTVGLHDDIRTGEPGRLRLVFHDNNVLNIGNGSQLTIAEQVFDPDRGVYTFTIRVLKGKMRPLVSTAFVIETATAVASVRGTEFVITYDPVADVTEVVGVTGTTEVHSVLDRVGHGVLLTAQERTTVVRGQFPTASVRLRDELFRQYLEDLDFIGGGRPESLTSKSTGLASRAPKQGIAVVPAAPGESPFYRENVIPQPPSSLIGTVGVSF